MNETDSTVETMTTMGTAAKRNYSKLRPIKYFKVQSRGAVGTMESRHERKVGAWAILVDCNDGKGLRLVTDIAFENGMVIKGEFKTRDDAYKAAMDYKAKWGKVSEKKEKKQEEQIAAFLKGKTDEEIVALIAAVRKAA